MSNLQTGACSLTDTHIKSWQHFSSELYVHAHYGNWHKSIPAVVSFDRMFVLLLMGTEVPLFVHGVLLGWQA